MDFKDKINEAINEAHLNQFGNYGKARTEFTEDEISNFQLTESDIEWLKSGGSLGGHFQLSNGNGNRNGQDKSKINNTNASTLIDAPPDIPDKNYFEYLVKIIKKTVKQEDGLIRQILYTAFSADLEPLNLGINAPTSEGKTYPIIESLKYFPKGSVIFIGKMSTMALVREQGILVDENSNPIQSEVDGLRYEIKHCKDEEERNDLKHKLFNLLLKSKKLIVLTGKILVFLETPDSKLWELIKPILSHDKDEMDFSYVNRTEKTGIQTVKVVVRGFPACIYCSAKDESNWPTWPEIQSRFLITSPSMTKEKYEESTLLIAQKKGLPSFIQNQVIVSNKDIELAKQCVQYIKQELKKLTESRVDVWIPYYDRLGRAIRTDKGTDVRNNGRIFDLLNIVTLIKFNNRQRLSIGENHSIIATLEDLSEVLAITQNLNGIPAYKIKFFKEVFYPLYNSKKEPDKSADGTKEENEITVTTSQLRDEYKSKFGKIITVESLKKTFLNELHNNGFIEEEDSIIDKRYKIYRPLIPGDVDEKISLISNSGQFDNFLQHSPLLLPKNCKLPPKNWLEMEISGFTKYRIDETSNEFIRMEDFKILDNNDNRVSIDEFIKKYELHVQLIRYFKSADSNNNNNISDVNTQNNDSDTQKDVKNYRIGSNSIIKIYYDLMFIHKTSQLLKIMQYVKTICVGCNNIIFVEKNSRIDHKRTCPDRP